MEKPKARKPKPQFKKGDKVFNIHYDYLGTVESSIVESFQAYAIADPVWEISYNILGVDYPHDLFKYVEDDMMSGDDAVESLIKQLDRVKGAMK